MTRMGHEMIWIDKPLKSQWRSQRGARQATAPSVPILAPPLCSLKITLQYAMSLATFPPSVCACPHLYLYIFYAFNRSKWLFAPPGCANRVLALFAPQANSMYSVLECQFTTLYISLEWFQATSTVFLQVFLVLSWVIQRKTLDNHLKCLNF